MSLFPFPLVSASRQSLPSTPFPPKLSVKFFQELDSGHVLRHEPSVFISGTRPLNPRMYSLAHYEPAISRSPQAAWWLCPCLFTGIVADALEGTSSLLTLCLRLPSSTMSYTCKFSSLLANSPLWRRKPHPNIIHHHQPESALAICLKSQLHWHCIRLSCFYSPQTWVPLIRLDRAVGERRPSLLLPYSYKLSQA